MRQWAAHDLRGANAACDARLWARPITEIAPKECAVIGSFAPPLSAA